MPLNTNLNVSPYFDDYDANNQYYRILFRPGTAVQARELTQSQSILQNQIESFGNWAFKNGDIVSGCAITDNPYLPYVRMDDSQANAATFNTADLVNTYIISASSNLQARVIISNHGFKKNYPNTNIVYIDYINSGTNNEVIFSPSETLNFYSISTNTLIASINTFSNTTGNTFTTGNAHGISVSEGIAYLNGVFVKVLNPTYGLVNPYDIAAGNNIVGFQLLETIVTENQDPSLTDNALGYSNENAPGAHRLKLVPTLVTLDPETATNIDGFNPIARYNYGSLTVKEVASDQLHSIVDSAISKRIYEESGNYVVNQFVIDTISGSNSIAISNSTQMLARVNPGVGYAQGHRVHLDFTTYVPVRRGVDTKSYKQQQITFNYGSYYVINEVAGSFAFTSAQSVDLYSQPSTAITNRTFGLTSPAGVKIGTALVKSFSYASGTIGLNTATYNLHLFNISMLPGYNTDQVKSIYYNNSIKAIGDVASNGLQNASTKDQLYSFGISGLQTLKDSSNNNNTEYVYRTANTTATMLANGYVTITIPGSSTGGNDILPYGPTGPSTLNQGDGTTFVLTASANNQTAALSALVSVNTSSNIVSGNGATTFATSFYVGDQIKVGTDIRTVTNISNNTIMTVDAPFSIANGIASYYKFIYNGKIIPIYQNGSTGGVYITNSTCFSIATGLTLAQSNAVTVTYDTLRTNAIPASKIINKDRFVKIQANTNPAGPNGPFCLGISDVHQIKKIYGSADGTYTTSGADLTSSFSLDTGQKDTHYDLAKIYPKAGYSSTVYPYLLVQLDYFTSNTTAGVGFYTVESYPINASDSVSNTTIQTKDIPLYVDEGGVKRWLRDYIDFRIPSTSSANNTGIVNTSNSTQVNTAISYATLNPSNTLVLTIPGGGLNTPSYGRNLQADYTIYLPRKDIVLITPENTLKIKEGQSSLSPQSPLYPDNAMTLAVLNIPAYPSLTTDEVDSDRIVNQNSINLIRDTSGAVNINLVTNRRYTMKDIGKLDNRISDLEYYTSLSLLEQKAKSTSVTDSNGLDRFKNGIFVDPFNDFKNSDVSNPEYSIAIDPSNSIARPKFITEVIILNFNANTSTNIQQTGRVLTLPYTSQSFLSQPYATKYRSSAHVASAWNGSMILMPAYSNHVDTNNTASISITIDNATPWKEFANSPMGSSYGSWKTTSNVTSHVVQTGTANVYNVELGYQGGPDETQAALDAAIGRYQAAGYQVGSKSITFTGSHGGEGSNSSIKQIV